MAWFIPTLIAVFGGSAAYSKLSEDAEEIKKDPTKYLKDTGTSLKETALGVGDFARSPVDKTTKWGETKALNFVEKVSGLDVNGDGAVGDKTAGTGVQVDTPAEQGPLSSIMNQISAKVGGTDIAALSNKSDWASAVGNKADDNDWSLTSILLGALGIGGGAVGFTRAFKAITGFGDKSNTSTAGTLLMVGAVVAAFMNWDKLTHKFNSFAGNNNDNILDTSAPSVSTAQKLDTPLKYAPTINYAAEFAPQ